MYEMVIDIKNNTIIYTLVKTDYLSFIYLGLDESSLNYTSWFGEVGVSEKFYDT